MKKVIEITGIGHPNKGAELMFLAVMEQLRARLGDSFYGVCTPAKGQLNSFRTIVDAGAYLRLKAFYRRFDFGSPIGNLLPVKVRRMFGCFAEKEIDVVLDASGLRYSDKFGVGSARHALRQYRRVKQRGGRVVLLPQAFGPFTCPKLKDVVREIWQYADLLFARERESFEYLTNLVGSEERIKIAPDFTNLIQGVVSEPLRKHANKVCVIPNAKMLAGVNTASTNVYLQGMVDLIRKCRKRGLSVFILNHEGKKDADLCRRILDRTEDKEIAYLSDLSALETKGLIGLAAGVITSRFHGLVSALSQGVPALATSWSHKYERLLEDYDVHYGLIDFTKGSSDVSGRLEQWIRHVEDPDSVERKRLSAVSHQIKKGSTDMWEQVFAVLEG